MKRMSEQMPTLLLTLILTLFMLCGSAFAADNVKISVGSVTAKPGQEVTIPVSISNNTGVAGIALDFTLASGVELQSITAGDVLSTGTFTPNGTVVSWFGNDNITANGVLMNIKVKAPSKAGSYSISAAPRNGKASSICDEDSRSVAVTFAAGTLKVEDTTPTKVDLSKCTVTLSKTSYTYDGNAKTPTVTVKNGNTTLTKDTDYTVAYKNNTEVGTATVTVTGKGNYTGSKSATFQIIKAEPAPVNLSKCTVTLSQDSFVYDGSEKKPKVTVKSGNTTLKEDTDYEVFYKNNINAGTASIAITGKGNYSGSTQINFTIEPVDLNDEDTITVSAWDLYYSGEQQNAYLLIYWRSTWDDLILDSDYTLSGDTTAKELGQYKITITGIGNYTGTVERTYSITLKDEQTIFLKKKSYTKKLGDKPFKLNAAPHFECDMTYRSSNTKVVTVSKAGKVTIKGVGKATITIKAEEDYSSQEATAKVTITVKKPSVKATAVSKLTNVKGKKMTVKWKKVSPTTGYQIQYTTDSKFKKEVKTVIIKSAKTTSSTIAKLTKKKKYYVRIRTYRTVCKQDFFSGWSKAKTVTIKK